MQTYTAYITPRNGITRRIALVAFDIDGARAEAQLIGRAMFHSGFTFGVVAS